MGKRNIKAEELEVRMTCCACPEQYRVYAGGKPVGYIRLRWGMLSCWYGLSGRNLVGDELLLTHDFGEEYKGCFSGDAERAEWLGKCREAIAVKMKRESARDRRLRKHKRKES